MVFTHHVRLLSLGALALFVLFLLKMPWGFYRDGTESVDCSGQQGHFDSILQSGPRPFGSRYGTLRGNALEEGNRLVPIGGKMGESHRGAMTWVSTGRDCAVAPDCEVDVCQVTKRRARVLVSLRAGPVPGSPGCIVFIISIHAAIAFSN